MDLCTADPLSDGGPGHLCAVRMGHGLIRSFDERPTRISAPTDSEVGRKGEFEGFQSIQTWPPAAPSSGFSL